jgi:predicted aconitase with swiveling domain
MSWQSQVLFAGEANGEVLRLDAPISFWGGVDPVSSTITLAGHPQLGEKIVGKILVLPQLIGSSSSSAVMLELIYAGMAPGALILGSRDAILPMGVVVASQMGWSTIPVVVLAELHFTTGQSLSVAEDGTITEVR